MSGDYTRMRYTPRSGYIGVFEQQGRVRLDADGNELVESIDRRRRAEAIDTIGHGVVPQPTPTSNAFQIGFSGGQYTIGPGRAYVDGILVDCWGDDGSQTFQPDLGEMRSINPLLYTNQPFYYGASFPMPVPTPPGGVSIVYLDVWEREVTALEDPLLIDPAIEGIDTTTRLQAAWQVKAIGPLTSTATCSDPVDWQNFLAGMLSTGRLSSATVPAPASGSPCVIDPQGGYTGLENRLYRVQIQTDGPMDGAGAATFVWSEDNACLGANLLSITHVSGTECQLSVNTVGRDKNFGFKAGDNLEVLDDFVEWSIRETKKGGSFVVVTSVDPEQLTINVNPDISGLFPVVAAQNPRIRKWDAAPQVTNNGTAISLGPDGVTVTFGPTPADTLHAGDFWVFYARTATGKIEILNQAAPRGVLHHYMKLAVVNPPNPIQDCRVFWPPPFGGEGCCTVVVNVGDDIQQAINSLPRDIGGCVCLKAGVHTISTAIVIAGNNIMFHGESIGAVVQNSASSAALIINEAHDITVEDISFVVTPKKQGAGIIQITTADRCAVRNCRVGAADQTQTYSPGFLIRNSNQIDVRGNFVTGTLTGIFSLGGHDLTVMDNSFAGPVATDNNNEISGGAFGVELSGPAGVVRIEGNEIADFSHGVMVLTNGQTGVGTSFSVERNIVSRHALLTVAVSPFPWTDPLGALVQNKYYGIATDCPDGTIAENTVQLADPGHGGILVCGPGIHVRDNSIPSSIAPPTAFDWPSMPVGIVAYKPLLTASVDHCRVIGNSMTGPQKGIAVLAEASDTISVPVVTQNSVNNGATPEAIDVTVPEKAIPPLQSSLESLGNVFGILIINADRATVAHNVISSCTVGIAEIAMELFFVVELGVATHAAAASGLSPLLPNAVFDGNEVDSSTIGVLLMYTGSSLVLNGALNNNQVAIGLVGTNAVTVARNRCSNINGVVHCLDYGSNLPRFEENFVTGGQTGLLAFQTTNVCFENNVVVMTNGTGIVAKSCEGEIRIEGNDLFNCGQTGQSAIERSVVGVVKTWELQMLTLPFGTAVAAGIAVVECSGFVDISECEVRDTMQLSAGNCLDICVVGNTGAAHTRLQNCRIVRTAPSAASSRGILVLPAIDREDPSFMSAHVSNNRVEVTSPSPATGSAGFIAVDMGINPNTLQSSTPCDILFNNNLVIQRGTRYGEPSIVRLSADTLTVTGNRIRSILPSLDITSGEGLTYVGNVVSTQATITHLFPSPVLPTPPTSFNVVA